ncbi:hypothetical protein [Actinobacillus minor]|uniref:hypothetical protein n=1 Tax=Actinobacillus minor TaxID=51047 RepID=UPI0026E92487|nr:hypothetical protein [Actinobacillus minor]
MKKLLFVLFIFFPAISHSYERILFVDDSWWIALSNNEIYSVQKTDIDIIRYWSIRDDVEIINKPFSNNRFTSDERWILNIRTNEYIRVNKELYCYLDRDYINCDDRDEILKDMSGYYERDY